MAMASPNVTALCSMLLSGACMTYNTGSWPLPATTGPPPTPVCESWFAGVQPGSLTDTNVNSIGCRQNYANMAQTPGQEYYCRFAALSGGGVCGKIVETVCPIIVNNLCGTPTLNGSLPTGWAGNASQCVADLTPLNAIIGANQGGAGQSENSIECRLYHAEVGALNGGAAHCGHPSNPSTPCTAAVANSVDQYCGLIETTCTGSAYQQYFGGASFDRMTHFKSCNTTARTFPPGTGVAAANNNDLSSRIYHVGANAAAGGNSAAGHCAHAGPSGGGVLGNSRVAWLNVSSNAVCSTPGNQYIYAQIAAAMLMWPQQLAMVVPVSTNLATYSVGMPDVVGAANTNATNTDACRIYHMTAAASGAPVHCVHGSVVGGGQCGDATFITCQIISLACPGNYATIGACQAAFGPYFANAATMMGNPCGPLMQPPQIPADDTIACRVFYATKAIGAVGMGGTGAAADCLNAKIAGATGCNVTMPPSKAPTTSDATTVSLFGGLAFLALLW